MVVVIGATLILRSSSKDFMHCLFMDKFQGQVDLFNYRCPILDSTNVFMYCWICVLINLFVYIYYFIICQYKKKSCQELLICVASSCTELLLG